MSKIRTRIAKPGMARLAPAQGPSALLDPRRTPLQESRGAQRAAGTTDHVPSSVGVGFNFADISIFPPTPVQAKLTVGQPNDKFERQADSVANTVMHRTTGPSSSNLEGIQQGNNPNISRSTGVEGGQSLPKAARRQLEPHLGFDFSQVRIHTSKHSVDATQALNARAFTMGRDIFFWQRPVCPPNLEWPATLGPRIVSCCTARACGLSTAVSEWPASKPAGCFQRIDADNTGLFYLVCYKNGRKKNCQRHP